MKEMRSRNIRSIVGSLFFICATVFYFFSSAETMVNFNTQSLWALCIILPSILWMCIWGIGFFNSVLFYAGFGMLLYEGRIIDPNYIIELMLTLSLMAIGLIIIGSIGKKPPEEAVFNKKRKYLEQDSFKYSAVFLPSNAANYSKNITGGTAKSYFCTSAYDISEAIIKNNAEIMLACGFGRLILVIPENSKIVLNSSASFGHIINRTKINGSSVNTISIKAKATFGEIIIKN